jgi:hypothetical protein
MFMMGLSKDKKDKRTSKEKEEAKREFVRQLRKPSIPRVPVPNVPPSTYGGKVNRRKKFDQWFKSIGSKFKTLNHNLQPIKQAATKRVAEAIEYYDNPQAQAQAAIDMAQQEAKDTAKLFGKSKAPKAPKEPQYAPQYAMQPYMPQYAPYSPQYAMQPYAPQYVDTNDDGQVDAIVPYQYFGGKAKRGPSSSPWIAHVKKYAAENNMHYGQALKEAKASYRGSGAMGEMKKAQKRQVKYAEKMVKGGAMYPAGMVV